jgi:acetoin utilization deacetylase AcuC-like enzyme
VSAPTTAVTHPLVEAPGGDATRAIGAPILLLLLLAALILFGSSRPAAAAAPVAAPQEIWYHTGYPGGVAGRPGGMSALTGPMKMPAIFEAAWKQRLVDPSRIHTDSSEVEGRRPAAPPIDLDSLRSVHTDRYLKAILTGEPRSLATSQGLPVWTAEIARGWLLNVGGLYAASAAALRNRTIAANLGHGYHHATADRGMGFCTINGLVVAAQRLFREGKASRVMILDLDHHEGNGTAELILGKSWIWNVSIYGAYMGGPPAAANNHLLRVHHGELAQGAARDAHYLAAIAAHLPDLIQRQRPDLILYQAGMDPFDGAGIGPEALAVRDAYVFAQARSRGIPVAWVLAGGYADLDTLVRLHTGTVRMANQVLGRVRGGDRIEHGGTDPYVWSAEGGRVRFPAWQAMIRQPRWTRPAGLSEAEARERRAARDRLLRDQRLPDQEIQTAYHALVPAAARR